jgi:hypothetical protein
MSTRHVMRGLRLAALPRACFGEHARGFVACAHLIGELGFERGMACFEGIDIAAKRRHGQPQSTGLRRP